MLWTIAIILLILWLLGGFVVNVGGSLIHIPARYCDHCRALSRDHGPQAGVIDGERHARQSLAPEH